MAFSADFGIYTAANDRMLPFLETWLGNLRTFHPDVPLAVLPFDDDVDAIRRAADRGGLLFCDSITHRWRALGHYIYKDAEYRPGALAGDYFSKLAAFDGPFERFLFLDVNGMVFFDTRRLLSETSPDTIYFLYEAVRYANFADDGVAAHYRELIGAFNNGYNANFFLSSRGRISFERALADLTDPAGELRALFGFSGEQSFLSWYTAQFGVPSQRTRDSRLGVRGWVHQDLSGPPEAPVNPRGQRVHHIKWNGPTFEETLHNYWLLAHYRPIGQALLA